MFTSTNNDYDLGIGVMQLLDRVRFGDDGRTLLDEVDVISSASGGSIPAAYYGLYGKDVFLRDFSVNHYFSRAPIQH